MTNEPLKATQPLPWASDPLQLGCLGDISTADGVSCIAQVQQIAGDDREQSERRRLTAFIVHAVNSHHDLIEALRAARDLLLAIEQNDQNVWWVNHDDPEKAVCDTYSKVWSALTKAEAGHG